ncbi:hypothetical protein pb186bvf_008469 [Paramecium bursaria]
MNLIYDGLKQLDLFSIPIHLKMNKSDQFNSKLGMACSLGLIIFCLVFGIQSVIDVINMSNPTVISAERWNQETEQVYLGPNNYTYALGISDSNLIRITQDGIYSLSVQNCHRQRLFNQNATLKCYNYTMSRCTKDHFKNVYQQQFFIDYNISGLHCINYQEWQQRPLVLQGQAGSNNFQYVQFFLKICNNQSCLSNTEIQQKLDNGYFTVYKQDTMIDFYQSTPFVPIIQSTYTTFNTKYLKQYTSFYKLANIYTDIGFFVQNLDLQPSIFCDSESETLGVSSTYSIIEHSLQFDQRFFEYYRSYPKILDIIGVVGGLQQAIYWCTLIIVGPIVKFLMDIEMINQFFVVQLNSSQIYDRQPLSKRMNITSKKDAMDKLKLQKESYKISKLQFFSALFRCNRLNQEIISNCRQQLDKKLDITNIQKKLREIEKLKKLLLPHENQLMFRYMKPQYINQQIISSRYENSESAKIKRIDKDMKLFQKLKYGDNELDSNTFKQLDQDYINLFEYFIELEESNQNVIQDISNQLDESTSGIHQDTRPVLKQVQSNNNSATRIQIHQNEYIQQNK